jgi:hypothetical protein
MGKLPPHPDRSASRRSLEIKEAQQLAWQNKIGSLN